MKSSEYGGHMSVNFISRRHPNQNAFDKILGTTILYRRYLVGNFVSSHVGKIYKCTAGVGDNVEKKGPGLPRLENFPERKSHIISEFV